MTLEQTKHLLKVRMGYEVTTSTGHTWIPVSEGWLDTTSKLVWKYEDEEGEYTFDDAVSRFGESLPSKAEWEEAEKHGIREVLDLNDKWLWSSSVYSNSQNLSWYFFGTSGYVNLNGRNLNFRVRCVSRGM